MTTNRLTVSDGNQKPRIVTKEMLEGLVVWSNALFWVKQSGRPYFLNKRTNDDGTITHFLDRVI